MTEKPKYDVPCKIGTVPTLVRVHGGDKIEVGKTIHIQEGPNADWVAVTVRSISQDGHFQADR